MIKYYDFEDILIIPTDISYVSSRKDVSLEVDSHLLNIKSVVPICAANMEGVGTFEMALALSKFKWPVFIHKHYKLREWESFYTRYSSIYTKYAVPTFGTSNNDVYEFVKTFPHIKTICFDVANGHTIKSINFVLDFKNKHSDIKIIYGNVANPYILKDLNFKNAISGIKIGIGSGSVCSTRTITGLGFPQASLVMLFREYMRNNNLCNTIELISDGGCRTPGDVVKAFMLGADMVMLGGMLSGHVEGGDSEYFYGSSSEYSKSYVDKDYLTPEGLSIKNKHRGHVSETVKIIEGGLRSAFTYSNLNSLNTLINDNKFNLYTGFNRFGIVRRQTNNYI